MKTVIVNIENQTVTVNGQTVNFYEAGLYSVGSENEAVLFQTESEIVEALTENEEMEVIFE